MVEEGVSKILDKTTLQGKEEEEGRSVAGGAHGPPSQVPIFDALLDDIYDLRFQLSQANPHMYRYQDERDQYRRERDDAHTSSQVRVASTSTGGAS